MENEFLVSSESKDLAPNVGHNHERESMINQP